MNSEASPAEKLPRRVRWYLPMFFAAWACALVVLGLGSVIYLLVVSLSGTGRLPGLNPIVAVVIGLAGGLCTVAVESWLMRRQLEAEARALALGELPWRSRLTRAILVVAIFGASGGILYLVTGPASRPLFLLWMGSLLVPGLFSHNVYRCVVERAKQLIVEQLALDGGESETTDRSEPSRASRWANVLGVLAILGTLALGAWLQWGIPWLAQREPKEYVTDTEPGGMTVQLTYRADAAAPALSPDGTLIAYVSGCGAPYGYNCLQLMRPDGSGKRRVGTDTGPSPNWFSPLAWSPDGSRILLIGEQQRPVKNWSDIPEATYRHDVWVVNATTGAARRLTDRGRFICAIWLSATGRIAALENCGRKKGARLVLMDESGKKRVEVADLKLPDSAWAVCCWQDGRAVLVAGRDESAGIWSVDANTGRPTRLSDLPALWAIPLSEDRLVIAVDGQPHPPMGRATSVGILNVATGAVRWVLRDIQGSLSHPSVVGKPPALIARLALPGSLSLWALRLRDGRLGRLTGGESIWAFSAAPDAAAIFYAAHLDRRRRSLRPSLTLTIWRLDPGRHLL